MGFKRIVAAAIVLALLVGGSGVVLVFAQVATLRQALDWVDHTRTVIETDQRLVSLIEEADDAERGYLIAGEPRYLLASETTSATIPMEEARLRALVSDNPARTGQVTALATAIEQRRSMVDQTIAVARSQGLPAARAFMTSFERHGAMQDIHARSSEIVSLENELLVERSKDARHAQALTLSAGLAVSLVALLALTGGLILMARINRRLNKAISEAREAQAARESIGALTNALFANVPDYLIVLNVESDDRYVVADINQAFEKVLGVSAGRVRGRAIDELLPTPVAQRLVGHYRRVRAAGQPVTTRDQISQLPGGPRVWESILAPVRDGEGPATRLIGSVRDITDRVRAEERLRDAQRMEAIGQLTGGVAHDFNNLLQVIRGNLELLQTSVAADERSAARLKNALYGAERAAQLTRQLLAFARRQPLAPKVVNLSRLVSDMADLLRRTLGEAIEVETVVAGGLWNTIADPAQVESALLNLALNARDAMPDGGRLTVEITNAVLDENYASAARDVAAGQYVMLAVSDTGEGMSEEVRARVFEPFFTTKTEGKGTGLGLSMVYGFVKQSNGHIQIYSEIGHGTTVKIYLPRSRQAVTSAGAAAGQEAPPREGQTVLVVEDEEAVREAALAMLEELGYRCLAAANAEAALKLVVDGAEIDLVFTDVVMPGTLRTRDFAQQVKALRPDVPILFTSGYTDNAIIHQGRLDEGVHLLSKPYAKSELARRIAQLLAEPGPDEQAAP